MSDADRFWSKVDASGDCWQWTAGVQSRGYGFFSVGGRKGHRVYAHRWVWEHLVGPIPPSLSMDHLCKNKLCVNPDHLEPVTQGENVRRGAWAKKRHCAQGHLLEGDDLYIRKNGQRMCRRCNIERNRVRRAREKAAATPDRNI